MNVQVVAASILADESKKSGPIGLAVILVLCVACYFLFKSMSKHLRKVREEFPADPADAADPDPGATPQSVADQPVEPTGDAPSDAPRSP